MTSELGEREVLLSLMLLAVFCSQRTVKLPCLSALLVYIWGNQVGDRNAQQKVDWQLTAIIAT